MRKNKPISVTLGDLQERVEARVQSGRYASASEVMRAALRALDREDDALDELMRLKIRAALDDPRQSLSAKEVFDKLREHHATRVTAEGYGV